MYTCNVPLQGSWETLTYCYNLHIYICIIHWQHVLQGSVHHQSLSNVWAGKSGSGLIISSLPLERTGQQFPRLAIQKHNSMHHKTTQVAATLRRKSLLHQQHELLQCVANVRTDSVKPIPMSLRKNYVKRSFRWNQISDPSSAVCFVSMQDLLSKFLNRLLLYSKLSTDLSQQAGCEVVL